MMMKVIEKRKCMRKNTFFFNSFLFSFDLLFVCFFQCSFFFSFFFSCSLLFLFIFVEKVNSFSLDSFTGKHLFDLAVALLSFCCRFCCRFC